ncbi:MAG TPA: hypothetical protein VF743_02855, partial [Acidimicrobiales bacterium]
MSEVTADGTVVYDATWAPADSYRVYRQAWTGHPTTTPDVVARPAGEGDGGVEVVVSWNGATEVARWRVLGGADADHLAPLATAAKEGFETTVP